jgi:hypothetical protein
MPTFNAGDVVRLKIDDPPYHKCGDAGVVWGIYGSPPSLYEATFCSHTGDRTERMFTEDEVEKVSDIAQVYLTDALLEFRRHFISGE